MPPGKRQSLDALEAEALAEEAALEDVRAQENDSRNSTGTSRKSGPAAKKANAKQARPIKRARTVMEGAGAPLGETVSGAAYAKLQAKYDALRGLRETEAEQIYKSHRSECDARDKASADYIARLKADNERLQKQLAAAKHAQTSGDGIDSSTKARLDADIRELEGHLETAVERVSKLNGEAAISTLLQKLTNVTLRQIASASSGNPASEVQHYVMEVISTRDTEIRATFELAAPPGANAEIECMWAPTTGVESSVSDAIRAKLPSALTDGAICFEPKELPKFFKAVWAVVKDLKMGDL